MKKHSVRKKTTKKKKNVWEVILGSSGRVQINSNNEMHTELSEKVNQLLAGKKKTEIFEIVTFVIKYLEKRPNISQNDLCKLFAREKTFTMPSHSIMFSVIALFSGKSDRLPNKLLQKKPNALTDKEQKRVETYTKTVIQKKKKTNQYLGTSEHEKIAIICDNPVVSAQAKIATNLFSKEALYKEYELANYIRRTFGAEGLRHLLAIMVCMEEQSYKKRGEFVWNINEHLKRMGYKMNNRTYRIEYKRTAMSIMQIFLGLVIVAKNKKSNNGEILYQKLFNWVQMKTSEQDFEKQVFNGSLTIRAEDYWYTTAYSDEGHYPQYTKLLEKITNECHKNHALTIYLSPLFGLFWRRYQNTVEFKVKTLLDWCDLNWNDRRRKNIIRNLEKELAYMQEAGYLGKWHHNGNEATLNTSQNPFDCVLSLSPPDWLNYELKHIRTSRDGLIQTPIDIKTIEEQRDKEVIKDDLQEFLSLLKQSKLSMRKFAAELGVNVSMVSNIKHGRKSLPNQLLQKARNLFN